MDGERIRGGVRFERRLGDDGTADARVRSERPSAGQRLRAGELHVRRLEDGRRRDGVCGQGERLEPDGGGGRRRDARRAMERGRVHDHLRFERRFRRSVADERLRQRGDAAGRAHARGLRLRAVGADAAGDDAAAQPFGEGRLEGQVLYRHLQFGGRFRRPGDHAAHGHDGDEAGRSHARRLHLCSVVAGRAGDDAGLEPDGDGAVDGDSGCLRCLHDFLRLQLRGRRRADKNHVRPGRHG